MLRSGLHMPLQGTSERRPRALQIAVGSSSYLQPAIIAAHHLNGGAELQQLLRRREQSWTTASFILRRRHLTVTWKLCARLASHRGSGTGSIPGISAQTVRTGSVCKANSHEWRGEAASRRRIPDHLHTAYFHPEEIVCSWAAPQCATQSCGEKRQPKHRLPTAGCLL